MEPDPVPGGQTKRQPAVHKSKMCIANRPDDLGLAEPTSCCLCFGSTDLLGARNEKSDPRWHGRGSALGAGMLAGLLHPEV